MKSTSKNLFILIVCLLVLTSCAPTYSPYLYDQTSELKTQSLLLMDKATEPFSKYETKINLLKSDLESVSRQEQLRKSNQAKIKQWNLLLNPQGHLLYGFLHKWQQDTILSETFVNLERKLVGESFELLRETEKMRLK